MASEVEFSRRNFTALLAASGSAWAMAASATPGVGQEKEPRQEKVAQEKSPAAVEKEKPDAAPAPTAAELALHLLLARFPDDRLDPAAQASLLIDIERHQARSRALAQVELANGDEPGFLFAAYRRPEAVRR